MLISRGPGKQILSSLLCPAIPAVLHVVHFHVGNIMNKCIRLLDGKQNHVVTLKAEAQLIPMRLKQASLNRLRVSLKMTENILENFVQLFLVIIVTLTMISDTRMMDLGGIDDILKGGSSTLFLLVTGMISFASLVKGHLDLIMSKRNGMVGIVGKMILLPYICISIASRYGYSLLTYFSPVNIRYKSLTSIHIGFGS